MKTFIAIVIGGGVAILGFLIILAAPQYTTEVLLGCAFTWGSLFLILVPLSKDHSPTEYGSPDALKNDDRGRTQGK